MMLEVSILLARFWGGLFIILGLMSIAGNFLGRVIKYTDDKTITVSTGYITLLLGLITVVLHNIWVTNWTIAITLLGWATLGKGIMKVGFPDHVHKQAQMFKGKQMLWSFVIFLIGVFFLLMSYVT